jgi:hypothetical protein
MFVSAAYNEEAQAIATVKAALPYASRDGPVHYPDFFVFIRGHAVAYWLRHYAKSQKVTGSRSMICLILPAALDPAVHSASKRNKYQKEKKYVSGEQSAAGA